MHRPLQRQDRLVSAASKFLCLGFLSFFFFEVMENCDLQSFSSQASMLRLPAACKVPFPVIDLSTSESSLFVFQCGHRTRSLKLHSVSPLLKREFSQAHGNKNTILATSQHSSTKKSSCQPINYHFRSKSQIGNPGIGSERQRICFKHNKHFFISSTSRSNAVQAVTGYAFAGKPRTNEAEEEQIKQYTEGNASQDENSSLSRQPRQGFPSGSIIGAWVDATLKQGEAGEDALVFEKMKGEGDVIFGVADGVGGWSENGIDPALFSQSLMYHSSQYAKSFFACPERLEVEDLEHKSFSSSSSSQNSTPSSTPPSSPTSSKASIAEPGTPLDILQYAFQKTQEQKEVPAGSATACIVTFDSSKGVIRTANLGDSGFIVLRPGLGTGEETSAEPAANLGSPGLPTVHYQSKPQTHGFNTPLQLSKLPPEFRSDGSIDSKPSNADLWTGQVRDGDMVLVATDGFWDNVSVSEVLQLVKFIKDKHRVAFVDRMLDISSNPLAEEEDLANVLAHNLLSYALMCQFSTNKASPFEREAARYGIRYPGGKVDDVAIIMSLIVER